MIETWGFAEGILFCKLDSMSNDSKPLFWPCHQLDPSSNMLGKQLLLVTVWSKWPRWSDTGPYLFLRGSSEISHLLLSREFSCSYDCPSSPSCFPLLIKDVRAANGEEVSMWQTFYQFYERQCGILMFPSITNKAGMSLAKLK